DQGGAPLLHGLAVLAAAAPLRARVDVRVGDELLREVRVEEGLDFLAEGGLFWAVSKVHVVPLVRFRPVSGRKRMRGYCEAASSYAFARRLSSGREGLIPLPTLDSALDTTKAAVRPPPRSRVAPLEGVPGRVTARASRPRPHRR